MPTKFIKGSEWRRWELHIHTPLTKKNDQFTGIDSLDKWDKYFAKINSYPHELAALAVTDYLCIENYFKVKENLLIGVITKSIPLLMPNVELRISPITGGATPINIHCIFNPEFDSQIESRFLRKLIFHYGPRPFDASKSSLIELGRSYKNNPLLEEKIALEEGIGQFIVDFASLRPIFETDKELRENTFIAVSNKSNDGASGLAHHELIEGRNYTSLDATRQEIYRFVDGILSATPSDIAYFLGKRTDSPQEVIQKCGRLKPCFHGSDAHDYSKMFEPDLQRYCWIKADPTFNGLKQIIFEPEQRVAISINKPQQKTDYLVIEKVKFLDTSARKMFCSDWIELSDNLTCIIGGKSSGKSLLLYYIAKTLDQKQVESKFQDLSVMEYELDKMANFNFCVKWSDGLEINLKDNQERSRQITYLPQFYINYLAEMRGTEELKKLIFSFLNEKPSFSQFYKNEIASSDEINAKIDNEINEYFSNVEQYRVVSEEIKGLGDKSARQNNLDSKRSSLAFLQQASGFTDKENEDYSLLISNKKIFENRLSNFKALKTDFELTYPLELDKFQKYVIEELDKYEKIKIVQYSSDTANKYFKQLLANDNNELIDKIETIRRRSILKGSKIENLISFSETRLLKINADLLPFVQKMENSERIIELQTEIDYEEKNIEQIEELERKKLSISTLFSDNKKNVISLYGELLSNYNNIIKRINESDEYSKISEERNIKLISFVDYNRNSFNLNFSNYINKQSSLKNIFGDYFDENNNFIFENQTHLENIGDIFNKISEDANNIKFNQGSSKKNIIRSLFEDNFQIQFHLKQDEEDILKMSPGKKGLILLFLILHLSNAEYPILIDQPEDNLDNRTIYSELKDFVKNKKIQRQIIIVTHNANLVVPTDAENIIVANQAGQSLGKENAEFKFEYISGSIENTFRSPSSIGILNQMGIKEHVCEILEGGEIAFKEREDRYSLN